MDDRSDLKRKMTELWKETFHDSDFYIKLVFDTYFNAENAFVKMDGDTLVASVLGVPYEFLRCGNGGEKRILRGLYLCGVATRPEYRRRGIMANLMREAEDTAARRGFDFTFLIPADAKLRRYYRTMGYRDASYRKTVKNESNSNADALNIYSVADLEKIGNSDFIGDLASWCSEIEKQGTTPALLHSKRDITAILRDNENSFFLTDTTFDLKYPILAKVRSVVLPDRFPDPSLAWSGEAVKIIKTFYDSRDSSDPSNDDAHVEAGDDAKEACDSGDVPEFVKRGVAHAYPGASVSFLTACSDSIGGEPYAMLKVLNQDAFNSKCENPVFDISLMLD